MDSESNQVAIDAHPVNIHDSIQEKISILQLSSVFDNLTYGEYKSIFFLLIDYIGEEEYFNITIEDAPHMKEKLDQILNTINNDSILIELLGTMKQYQKLKTLGSCQHIYKLQERKFNNIDGVLKMLYSLCEELTDNDLEILKKVFPDIQDQIKTAEDWFYLALRNKLICRTDFSKLETIFQFYPNCLNIIKSFAQPNTYSIRTPSVNIHCGIAVILNYELFNEKLPKREGSTIDVNSLKDVWHKFGFRTDIWNNLTFDETVMKLSYYADLDHSNYDAFVCCILSHGQSNTIFSSDCKEMLIPFLISLITNKCSSLFSKPKLFFIQACQGTNIHQGCGEPVYDLRPSDMPAAKETYTQIHPNATDVLLVVSSINGFVSFRNKKEGSWLISALCKIMQQKGDKLSILDVIIEVNNLVRMNSANFGPGGPRNAQQTVNCINTFGKVLILKKRSN